MNVNSEFQTGKCSLRCFFAWVGFSMNDFVPSLGDNMMFCQRCLAFVCPLMFYKSLIINVLIIVSITKIGFNDF
jgi:hypothetical protein